MEMNVKPIFDIHIFSSTFGITSSVLTQWVVIILLAIISIALTRNLKKIPNKKQSIIEILVEAVNKLVSENMGEDYKNFVPFIGTLAIYILILNLTGLIGVEPPTKDLSVPLGLAAISFFVIQGNAIKRHGVGSYLHGYFKPMAPLLPINILERITLPISLCLRLFGNMVAGAVVMGLVYKALGHFAFVIPVPLHFYFDMFDGAIQMVIFVMLTMINIKIIAEH